MQRYVVDLSQSSSDEDNDIEAATRAYPADEAARKRPKVAEPSERTEDACTCVKRAKIAAAGELAQCSRSCTCKLNLRRKACMMGDLNDRLEHLSSSVRAERSEMRREVERLEAENAELKCKIEQLTCTQLISQGIILS